MDSTEDITIPDGHAAVVISPDGKLVMMLPKEADPDGSMPKHGVLVSAIANAFTKPRGQALIREMISHLSEDMKEMADAQTH